MWQVSFFVAAGVGVALALGVVWLWVDRRSARGECDRLRGELAERSDAGDRLRARVLELERDLAAIHAVRDKMQELSEKTQQQLGDAFKAAAGDALKQSGEQFLQLARKSLEGHHKDATHELEKRKQAIANLVDPIKGLLEKYQTSVQHIESARREAYGSLRQQLGHLVTDQRQLRDQTANLVKALRRPEVRGRWGEVQLRRVAELAGMIANCDFEEQVTVGSGQGASRPDMVVRLPSDRRIVVDAKTPLDAYLSGVEAETDDEREQCFARHTGQIESRVRELASKGYAEQFERSPDFVVLFIPGEPFLYEAAQRRPDLMESAMDKGVVIATPMTLVSLLKVVAVGWREQQVAESARQISEVGRQLHQRLCTAVDHLTKLGGSLDAAVRQYNAFVGSFETRVVASARRFEQLGSASGKALPPELPHVEAQPRTPKPVVEQV